VKALLHLLAAAVLVSWIGACGSVAVLAVRLAAALDRPAVTAEPPARSGLVLLHGDLGFAPQATGLGRGGPDAGVRPLRWGHRAPRGWVNASDSGRRARRRALRGKLRLTVPRAPARRNAATAADSRGHRQYD